MNREQVLCDVCPKFCKLREGQIGFCRARSNIGGKIVPINYGQATSLRDTGASPSLGSHRKEAADAFLLRNLYPFLRQLRLQPALPVLPECVDFDGGTRQLPSPLDYA